MRPAIHAALKVSLAASCPVEGQQHAPLTRPQPLPVMWDLAHFEPSSYLGDRSPVLVPQEHPPQLVLPLPLFSVVPFPSFAASN